jgi:ribosomal protein L11 methyltransferase
MPVLKKLWAASFAAAQEIADDLSEALADGSLSLAVVAPPRTGKAEIEAIFDAPPDAATLQTRIDILASSNDVKPPKLRIRELPKLDWLKKVSEDFPPLPIARWVVYGAQHREAAAKYRHMRLQIDATSAFGTGEHPTTRGCLLMLDWLLKRNAPANMLDVGCGTGILAMAFSKTTRKRAIGIDLDPDSVAIARNNIRVNGLGSCMRVALGNGYRSPMIKGHAPYDLIMANIFAGPLCRMAYDLKRHLKPGGMAILSGLLTRQANAVIAAHRMQRLYLVKHIKIGEWSVLALTYPSRAE